MVTSSLPVSDKKLHQFRLKTVNDQVLEVLSEIDMPNGKASLPACITDYWNIGSELSIIVVSYLSMIG